MNRASTALSDLGRLYPDLVRIRDELEETLKENPDRCLSAIKNGLNNLLVAASAEVVDESKAVVGRIRSLALGTPYQAKAEEFIAGAGGDRTKLEAIRDALQTKLGALLIRTRIANLAIGTKHATKALEYVKSAEDDVAKLLEIEKVLTVKLIEEDQYPH